MRDDYFLRGESFYWLKINRGSRSFFTQLSLFTNVKKMAHYRGNCVNMFNFPSKYEKQYSDSNLNVILIRTHFQIGHKILFPMELDVKIMELEKISKSIQ